MPTNPATLIRANAAMSQAGEVARLSDELESLKKVADATAAALRSNDEATKKALSQETKVPETADLEAALDLSEKLKSTIADLASGVEAGNSAVAELKEALSNKDAQLAEVCEAAAKYAAAAEAANADIAKAVEHLAAMQAELSANDEKTKKRLAGK